jgi:hypothetical protein
MGYVSDPDTPFPDLVQWTASCFWGAARLFAPARSEEVVWSSTMKRHSKLSVTSVTKPAKVWRTLGVGEPASLQTVQARRTLEVGEPAHFERDNDDRMQRCSDGDGRPHLDGLSA